MASYSLRIKASAGKEVERIEPKRMRRAIVDRIRGLAAEPRPPGCEKLSAAKGRYRVRQGSFRIVYEVRDHDRVVVVVAVAHRRDVYRRR